MQPIVDNLDFLTGDAMSNEQKDDRRRHGGGPKSSWSDLREMGLLEVEAINYIRGHSIPHQFMVVDEAQNLTPDEVKTIVTRVGEGTKIVFTGDPYQIDNTYVDAESNGLTWLAERLKGQILVGHMTLTRGERSALAELAANMLEKSSPWFQISWIQACQVKIQSEWLTTLSRSFTRTPIDSRIRILIFSIVPQCVA